MKLAILPVVVTVIICLTSLLLVQTDEYVHILACDVGQGDAILLWKGSTQILIDGGPDEHSASRCLNQYVPKGDTQIELVVVTHADADHIAGIAAVMTQYEVQRLLIAPSNKESAVFEGLEQLVQIQQRQKNLTVLSPYAGMQITIAAECSAIVLHPQTSTVSTPLGESFTTANKPLSVELPGGVGQTSRATTEILLQDSGQFLGQMSYLQYTDENERSIVLLFKFGSMTFLTTGDIGEEAELALLKSPLIQEVDILKISHHGSKTGTSLPFLEATKPEWALVSVGQNNSFGHPSSEVLSRLEERGVKMLRTDQLGDVHLASDGISVWQVR